MSLLPAIADTEIATADALARERALDPQRSILLQAPAGSGKTAVLTQRFLRLMCTVDEPEQILAITFTRKAAAEMRQRILAAFCGEASEEGPHGERLAALARAAREHALERGWALESHPARLRVHTIDALNHALAAQLPVAARSGGAMQLAADPQGLYRAAARRTLIDAHSDERWRADADLLLERLDNDVPRAEYLIATMLGARAHWLPRLLRADAHREAGARALLERIETSLTSIIEERLARARRTLGETVLAEGAWLCREAALRRELSAEPREGPWQVWLGGEPLPGEWTLRHWQGLAQLGLTEEGSVRAALTRREGFPPEEPALKERAMDWLAALRALAGARELLGEIASLPPAQLVAEDARALAGLARLLTLAASELELAFQAQGRMDHASVAAAARRALTEEGAPTDLALRLGEAIRHVLVDEFQDTSLEQCELLEALTAQWEPGDGRTLFVVGDPMQSIYQFREAEVGLFLRTRTHGLGALRLEPLALSRNFRAAGALIDWCNRVFPPCFAEADDPRSGAVRYTPSIPGRPCGAPGRVELHALPADDPAAEAGAVSGLITRLRSARPGASIAILVSARSHATALVRALEGCQIPVCGVDLVPLAELSLVRDLMALARALDHLGDRTAWLAVLRAPWCGLTLAQIGALIEGAPHRAVWELLEDRARLCLLEPESRQRLERTRTVLAEALAQAGRIEFAHWIERTWLRLGGPAAARAEELDNAPAVFEQLARWSAEPDWVGPLGIEDKLSQLYARHAEGADAVQVMTIHRAKGLEFDHVILPGLARRVRADEEPLLRWLELPREPDGTDLLMAPIPAPERRGMDPLNRYLKSLQGRRAAHERARLLYVAATRAREELHLFTELPQTPPGREPQPASGTLLSLLWPTLGAELRAAVRSTTLTAPPSTPAAASSGAASEPTALRRLVRGWTPPALDAPVPLLRLHGGTLETTEIEEPCPAGAEESWASVQAVREQLRRAARQSVLPEAGDRALSRALRQRLARMGLNGASLERSVERAVRRLEACLQDPWLRSLFAPGHRQVESPLDLTGVEHGRLVRERVDRAFIDPAGARWLVSFSAAVPGVRPGASEEPALAAAEAETFADAQLERHRAALERQRALAGELGPERPKVLLYVCAVQRWRELA